jgi:hypothetical protein
MCLCTPLHRTGSDSWSRTLGLCEGPIRSCGLWMAYLWPVSQQHVWDQAGEQLVGKAASRDQVWLMLPTFPWCLIRDISPVSLHYSRDQGDLLHLQTQENRAQQQTDQTLVRKMWMDPWYRLGRGSGGNQTHHAKLFPGKEIGKTSCRQTIQS